MWSTLCPEAIALEGDVPWLANGYGKPVWWQV